MSPTAILDWVTGALALATVGLATASWRSVSQTKRLHKQTERNRLAGLFRGCLVEQLDNCRQFIAVRPAATDDGGGLDKVCLSFTALAQLLGQTVLPAPVVRQLLAQQGIVQIQLDQVKGLVTNYWQLLKSKRCAPEFIGATNMRPLIRRLYS